MTRWSLAPLAESPEDPTTSSEAVNSDTERNPGGGDRYEEIGLTTRRVDTCFQLVGSPKDPNRPLHYQLTKTRARVRSSRLCLPAQKYLKQKQEKKIPRCSPSLEGVSDYDGCIN